MTPRPATGQARARRLWPRARVAQFAVLTAVLAFAAGTAVLLPNTTERVAGTALALPGTQGPDLLGDSRSGGQLTDVPGGGATPARPPDGQQQGQPSPQQPPDQQQQHQPAQQQGGQRPGTIQLPRGGTAKLVRQEVGADGTLPVPDGVGKATWWGVGLDAKKGATVFAGHVNWKGVTGPFAELWEAQPGTPVSVVDDQGRTYQFRISEILTLHKDELPSRAVELFGPRGPHRVVLVTCGGRWVGGQLGYDENRVVIATPQS